VAFSRAINSQPVHSLEEQTHGLRHRDYAAANETKNGTALSVNQMLHEPIARRARRLLKVFDVSVEMTAL
jgi:hypothetical protein